MKKEAIFAIITGISIGLIVAFGVWRANSAIKESPEISKSSPQGPVGNSEVNGLTISNYQDLDVVLEDKITVTGITKGGRLVLISGENADHITQTDQTGKFSQEISLEEGINTIIVSAHDQENSIEETIRIVYSSRLNDKDEES